MIMTNQQADLFIRWAYYEYRMEDLDDDSTFAANQRALASGQSPASIVEALLQSARGKQVLAARQKALGL